MLTTGIITTVCVYVTIPQKQSILQLFINQISRSTGSIENGQKLFKITIYLYHRSDLAEKADRRSLDQIPPMVGQ